MNNILLKIVDILLTLCKNLQLDHAKMAMPNIQRYPRNLYLINYVKDTLSLFLGLKVFLLKISIMFSCSSNARVTFLKKPQLKIIVSQKH